MATSGGASFTKSGGGSARPIFLSYVREEQAVVEGLARHLTSAGFDVYFDSKLAGGQDWWDELIGHVRKCQAFVPVLSHRYIHSNPCRLEREYATSLGKPFCPVRIDDVNEKLLPSAIGALHIAPFAPDDLESVLGIVRGLLLLPECPPLPDPLPPPPQAPASYLYPIVSQVDSPEVLTQADQWNVLSELKALLQGEDAADALKLLARFKKRPELLHLVVIEVDTLLATPTTTQTPGTPDTIDNGPEPPKDPESSILDLTKDDPSSPATPSPNVGTSPDRSTSPDRGVSPAAATSSVVAESPVCPYCHWGLVTDPGDPTVRCPSCGADYHQACWNENGGCARFGCAQWIRTQQHQPELQH